MAVPERTQVLGDALGRQYGVRHLAVPQAGLHLLTLRDGVFQEPFFLGEVVVAEAHVLVAGQAGGARLLTDTSSLAVAVAICDAVLAAELDGVAEVRALAQQGEHILVQREARRAAMRGAGRVAFADLSEADEPTTQNPGETAP